jgi:hypothetical protein
LPTIRPRRVLRDDRSATRLRRPKLDEDLGATREVSHDDVLQPVPEQPGQCRHVGMGGFHSVGHEPRERVVLLAQEGLHSGTNPLEPRLNFEQRLHPRTLA